MNKLSYGNFDISNADIAFDATSGYTEPASELERRKQLSYPLKEIKTFVNNTVAEDSDGNAIQLIKGNDSLQYRSTVGGTANDVYTSGIKYSDEEISVSLTANTLTGVTITNDAPDGYAPLNAIIRTGSTVSLRNDVMLMPTNLTNFNRVVLMSSSTSSGTITIRKYYIKSSQLVGV